MNSVTFNPAQIHILNMASRIQTEAGLQRFKEQMATFYAKLIDEEMDELWALRRIFQSLQSSIILLKIVRLASDDLIFLFMFVYTCFTILKFCLLIIKKYREILNNSE